MLALRVLALILAVAQPAAAIALLGAGAPRVSLRPTGVTCARATPPPTMFLGSIRDGWSRVSRAVRLVAANAIVERKVAEKLRVAQEKGIQIPEKYEMLMRSFFTSYMVEIYMAGKSMEKYEGLLSSLVTKVLETAKEPYAFEPYHKAIRDPFDYYRLGCDFAEGMVDDSQSMIVGLQQVEQMQKQIAAGDNVVLFANHQSEADPQIYSVLMDPVVEGFAENTVFVAGDRVTTDLLAMPFSMGRNLLCIFSKKHVDNPPELKSQKTRHNRNVMKTMQSMFSEGGKIIWVAPSGGRDRADDDGQYSVAPFDSKSVEMFRLMSGKSARPTHFYPLSMFTYPICPPPQKVGGEVGETRTVKFAPAALHFGEEVDVSQVVESAVADLPEGGDAREAGREALSAHFQKIVSSNYDSLSVKLVPLLSK